ncbi:hypothetical protein [Magnetofaba australis]|nr:hypothetical protein [Magnetofaba australis]
MLFKILLPILAIASIYALGRFQAQRKEALITPEQAEALRAQEVADQRAGRRAGLIALLLLVTLAATMAYFYWRDANKEMLIRVINIQSGETQIYRARNKDLHDRVFTTLDGRRVRLADLERMEVETAPSEP